MDIKKQIEALLFSAGRKLNIEELSRLLDMNSSEDVTRAAEDLKKSYQESESPLMIIEEGDGWKMTVREKYLPLVRNINPHTELSKTTMETLAVISWKSPVLQSTVIKIRTNKAYDHINELEELGFITREKYGRTFVLKLTQKFFEYFDLKDKKDISKLFKDFKNLGPEDQKKMDEFPEDDFKVEGEGSLDSEDLKMIDEVSKIEKEETKENKNKKD